MLEINISSDIEQVTERVEVFYENNPYPGLSDKLMPGGVRRESSYMEKSRKILYPGCGTGHGVVSMAVARPDLQYYGLDLSEPSLNIARQLAKKHGVVVEFKQGAYVKPLPWPFRFQYLILREPRTTLPIPAQLQST